MITQEKALQIAKDYAEQHGRGWDKRYHEASPITLKGEPVWMVSTSDVSYSDELPWMMDHMPSPSYYYISMVEAKCIALGNRPNEFQRVSEDN
ncbi:hypothetical protein HC231_00685 [Brenneria izadpanahii]|uniref:Phage protein n=1 Tax=Brenneria izadpanahii TaxID=2722756 RepID=A0ABX7UPZ9_9GAMM|nr:hypothetical protein [Brenneria izadpanahii]QTF06612.1 hypothetical protein HC231_00685 [Brenneria izadpanahii]